MAQLRERSGSIATTPGRRSFGSLRSSGTGFAARRGNWMRWRSTGFFVLNLAAAGTLPARTSWSVSRKPSNGAAPRGLLDLASLVSSQRHRSRLRVAAAGCYSGETGAEPGDRDGAGVRADPWRDDDPGVRNLLRDTVE